MANNNFLNEIFSSDVFVKNNSNKKSSIYKRELFADMLDDQKKKLRRQLRKNLQNRFLATFLVVRKNETELKKLSQIWQEYAPKVYNNVNVICEANTDADTQKLIKNFLECMAKFEGEKKAKATPKKAKAKKETKVEETKEETKQ